MWKYLPAWIPMALIAIANGVLREAWYGKHLGELQARQVSTVSGVLLFGVYIWVLLRIWGPESTGQAFTTGLMWLGLTVAKEPAPPFNLLLWPLSLKDLSFSPGHVCSK
jgi:hypothetical protein